MILENVANDIGYARPSTRLTGASDRHYPQEVKQIRREMQ
jgi:hypothetical protein